MQHCHGFLLRGGRLDVSSIFFFCSLWLNFTFLADLIFIRIVQNSTPNEWQKLLLHFDKQKYSRIKMSFCSNEERKKKPCVWIAHGNQLYLYIHSYSFSTSLLFAFKHITNLFVFFCTVSDFRRVFFFSLFFSKFCSDEYAHNGQIVIKINHPKKLISNHMFSKCENWRTRIAQWCARNEHTLQQIHILKNIDFAKTLMQSLVIIKKTSTFSYF